MLCFISTGICAPHLLPVAPSLRLKLLPHVHGLLVGLLSGLHLGPQLLVLGQLQVSGRDVTDGLLGGHGADQLAAPQEVVLHLESKDTWVELEAPRDYG